MDSREGILNVNIKENRCLNNKQGSLFAMLKDKTSAVRVLHLLLNNLVPFWVWVEPNIILSCIR